MRYRSISAILGIIFLIQTSLPGPLLSKDLQTEQRNVIKIPRSLGKITPSSSSNKDRIVFLIEDIHAQPQAQKNIYRILKLISRTHSKPLHILVEGSSKKIDLEPIRNMPSREAIEIVSQQYLANGTLSGEEFYAIHSEIPPNLQGAEIETTYQENLAIYREFKKRESSILSSLSKFEKSQDEKAKKFLNPELQTMIHKRKNYQRDQLILTKYSQFLLETARQKKITIQPYPNLKILSEAFEIEKNDDFKGIDQQIQKVLQEISKVAQKKDLQRLVKITLEAQLYGNKTSKYFELLQELVKAYSISSIESNRLKSYQGYASLLERVDAKKISEEERMLFKELGEKSCQKEEEKELFKSLFYFECLKNVLILKASPEDYQDSLSSELKDLLSAIKKEFPVLDQGLKISLKFYDSALERNHNLAHTLIHQAKSGEPSVLILGGFHTKAVQDLIEEKGIQAHIVTPQFSLENDPANYERMLLERHTPLGKLLTQEFSTLRQPPITDRLGDFLLLQLDILETIISRYADSADIRDFLGKSIVDARERQTHSPELLGQLELKQGPGESFILLGEKLALIVHPTNGKNSFWTSLNLSPQEIVQEKEKGAWSFQVIEISTKLRSQLEKIETAPPQNQIIFEKTPKNDRVWRFLSNPEFINQIGQTSNSLTIKVEFKGKSHQGKKIYKADFFDDKGQKTQSVAVKVYDPHVFDADRERITKSWERWNEMSKLDSQGRSIARCLGYSQREGILAQEWIEGKNLDDAISDALKTKDMNTLKRILRETIQNAIRLYLLSGRKYIPWDYLATNLIQGRFVDEDETLFEPNAHEIVSYLSVFSHHLQMFSHRIPLDEEYEFLWQAILDVFEKESSREKGLDFLYEAYFLATQYDANDRLLNPELNFPNFLLREYMNLTMKKSKVHPIIDDIEETISLGPKTEDYHRKLILGRPLRPGQISLHIGVHPSGVFQIAEAMSGLHVFGIDISDINIKGPQRRIKSKFKNLAQEAFSLPKFFNFDAEDLDEVHGFPADLVDHVTMKELFGGSSFINSPEKTEKIIRNIIHLVREGGTILLTDVNLNQNPRNPTEVEILKIVSERSKEWDLEWDIQPLGIKDHYESNVFVATLKKKTKKASRVKLERMFGTIWNILERYSNVHRGLGQHSQVSTHLFEKARYWIGEKLGIDSNKQIVILATSPTLAIESLAHNLKLEPEDHIITDSKYPPHFLNLRSTLVPMNEDLKIDLEGLKSYLKRMPTKLISIQTPQSLGLTPENISNLSRIVHENGARLLVDVSDWPVNQIHAKSLGIDYLIFKGSRVSPFAPTVILADLELLKTGEDEPPYETGGGTKEIARLDKVVWGKAPEKFEVGSPNIVGTILLASLLKNPEGLAFAEMPKLPHRNGYHSIKALEEALIGKDAKVPTRHGERTYVNFDNAASTPTFIPVLEIIKEYIQSMPPKKLIMMANAFDKILQYFGAPGREYDILTFRNTSEAINFLAYKLHLGPDALVVNSLLEHNSNELPWRGKNLMRLNIDENGFMDPTHLEKLLIEYNEAQIHGNQRIELVALSGASNVLGTVNDLAEISKLVHRHGAKFMIDAAQLAAHRGIDMEELDIDFLVYSSHKIYAPFGHGGLIFRSDLLKAPYREDSSPEGMIALAKMMGILTKIGLNHVAEHEEELLRYALEKFETLEKIPGVNIKIHGIKDPRSPLLRKKTGVVSFNIKIPDRVLPENLRRQTYLPYNLVSAVLAEEGGIGVRAGCFCADLLLQRILGFSDAEAARLEEDLLKGDRSGLPGTTRMSFGIYNTKEEIDRFFEILTNLAQGKYDLSKYQLNKKSGEYYTVEHLQAMERFLMEMEETVFGPRVEQIILDPNQEFLHFIENVRSKRDYLLPEGRELLDEYLEGLKKGQTIMFRDLYRSYLKVKETFSNLPYQFALWILKDFSLSSGKHHVVFIQRGSNTLGNLIKDLSNKLGWTHLKFHDLYINQKMAGFDRNEILEAKNLSATKIAGESTPEEIFQYLIQEELLDGDPILFIDTGILGSNPLFLRRLIQDPQLWQTQGLSYRKIDMSTRLFFFDAWPDAKEIRNAHDGQIEGFNETSNVNDESLDWYEIAYFLDKGAKHLYERPPRLIWKEGSDGKKIVPELLPSDAWTQVLSLVQALPFEDLIQERIIENDPSLQNLKSGSAPDISKSDTETILLSDQSIEGVSTQTLPKNKKIAIIEQTENDATAYAGNLIQRLEKENKIERFSLSNLLLIADFTDFLRKFQPDFVFLPQDRPELEDMIQDFVNEIKKKVTVYSYVSLERLPFQNFFYPFSAETAQIVKKAIQVHKSQVTRTAYDQIFDYSSQAAGQKLKFYQPATGSTPHAQAFRVGFIKNGELTITSNEEIYKVGPKGEPYTLNFDDDIPLLVISPHADDLEIAAGGFIRSVLEEKGPSRARVLNWVIGTGDEWGVILDKDFADLSEESQVGIKRSIRREEAIDAGDVLSKDTPGQLKVSIFSLLSASQYPQGPNAILPMNDPQVFKDLRFVQRKLDFLFDDYFDSFRAGNILTVILPHPEDAHPHHQMATKIVLEALSQLSIAHGISIQLLFYSSPWAGRFNTYYVSNENQMPDENAPTSLREKISIAERVKRSLGIILGELVAGFGKKPLSFDELGGEFTERFMRKTILPALPQKQVSLPEPEPQTLKIEGSQRIFETAA